MVCNGDCFHCTYDDCVNDELRDADFKAGDDLEKEIQLEERLKHMTPRQKAVYKYNHSNKRKEVGKRYAQSEKGRNAILKANKTYRDKQKRIIRLKKAERKRNMSEEEKRQMWREYMRKYRLKHKSKCSRYQREYYEKNKEKITEYRHEYYETHKEDSKQYEQEWRTANRDRYNQYQREHWAANKDKYNRNRREKRKREKEKLKQENLANEKC